MKRASRLSVLAVITSLAFGSLTAPNAFAANHDDQANPPAANNAQNPPAAPADDAVKDAKKAANDVADEVLASIKEVTDLAKDKEQTAEVKNAVGKLLTIQAAIQLLKGQIEAKTDVAGVTALKTQIEAKKKEITPLKAEVEKAPPSEAIVNSAKDDANAAITAALTAANEAATVAATKEQTAEVKEAVAKVTAAKTAIEGLQGQVNAKAEAKDVAALNKIKEGANNEKDKVSEARKVIDKAVSKEASDLVAAKAAATKTADEAIKVADEAIAAAKKKDEAAVKADLEKANAAKKAAEEAKPKIAAAKNAEELKAQETVVNQAKADAQAAKEAIDKVADKKGSSKSSEDKNVRTTFAVVLGVLGLGAIVAAIFQFAGPVLRNLGIELPKF